MEQEKKKKKQQQKQKQNSIHDILPLELIQIILLSVPARHLARFKCVSKLWYSLISDPHFAELHLQHTPAPTPTCLFIEESAEASLVHPEELFTRQNYEIKEVSLPFKKKNPPSDFRVMGSCRGFVLLNLQPHFLVVWNPLTGSSKKISYSFIVSRSKRPTWSSMFPGATGLYGLGYDACRDDYLVFVGWHDSDFQHHLDCISLRTNSWVNLDSALPKPFNSREWKSPGLFLNGSIHWLVCPYFRTAYSEAILIFDLKERSFSMISIPEEVVTYHDIDLVLLGGCIAIYCRGVVLIKLTYG
ncbi:hypothetical protein PIB30_047493 [Stylosanthes scabra]|uniref:F-box domain-containing protein n=1 Tax=Stylosanthes scabra TaxID=79078 RepID=A0ABU6TGL1_9FABA|nr:hypothetical protein [Stylosanthes scabra]